MDIIITEGGHPMQNSKIPLPSQVTYILKTLEQATHEAFIVGGCVRDIIRTVQPKDWDIATSATPEQTKALFPRTVDTGIKHGTVTVLVDSKPYEVTTYRIDGEYIDNRRPTTVEFVTDITEDLSRRDFTMNAIAYNPHVGFVDPFCGRKDIDNKLIRCVGEPVLRFTEDALRMLRAVRFAGQTGFDVCTATLQAIGEMGSNLSSVSPERIREELGKLLTSLYPSAVGLLESTGLLSYIIAHTPTDKTEMIHWLESCPTYEPMRTALFLHHMHDTIEATLRNLRYDNKSIKEVSLYVKMLHTPIPQSRPGIKKILRQIVSQDFFDNLLVLKSIVYPYEAGLHNSIRNTAADIYQKGECYTLRDLAINGRDLAAAGFAEGEGMGVLLEKLLEIVIDDPMFNTRKQLLECAMSISAHKTL